MYNSSVHNFIRTNINRKIDQWSQHWKDISKSVLHLKKMIGKLGWNELPADSLLSWLEKIQKLFPHKMTQSATIRNKYLKTIIILGIGCTPCLVLYQDFNNRSQSSRKKPSNKSAPRNPIKNSATNWFH